MTTANGCDLPDDLYYFVEKHIWLRPEGEEVVMEWALRRCQDAREAKRISVNRDLLRYESDLSPLARLRPQRQ